MSVPPGFAHGFIVTSDFAELRYKVTDYYAPEHERVIRWNVPALAIAWPGPTEPAMSDRYRRGASLAEAETYS